MKNLIFYYLAVDKHTGEIIPGSLGNSEAETKRNANAYRQLKANEQEIVAEHPDKYGYTIEQITQAQYYDLIGQEII